MAETITATTIERLSWRNLVLQDVPVFPDANGDVFEAIAFLDAGNGRVRVQKKERDTGRLLRELTVTPNNGMKVDSCGIFQSGANVHGRIGTHMPGAQDPEIGEYQSFVWLSVAAPYAQGVRPQTAPGAYIAPQNTGGGGGMTEQETIIAVEKGVGSHPQAYGAPGTYVAALGASNRAGYQVRETHRSLYAQMWVRFLDSRNNGKPGYEDAPAFQSTIFTFFRNAIFGVLRKHIFGDWSKRAQPGYEVETQEFERKMIAITQTAIRWMPPEGQPVRYAYTMALGNGGEAAEQAQAGARSALPSGSSTEGENEG